MAFPIRKKTYAIAAGALLVALTIAFAAFGGNGNAVEEQKRADALATFPVQRGPLLISVDQSGSIVARDKFIVKSEVKDRTSLVWLVDEGTQVKKGDLLAELSANEFVTAREEQQLRVINAENDMLRAEEDLKGALTEIESAIATAELNFKFSKMELEKYQNGEYPQELKKATTDISIAEEELQRAKDKLAWSQKLFEEGYVTRSELQADQLSLKQKEIRLELANGSKQILETYTHRQQLERLKLEVEDKERRLEREHSRAASRKNWHQNDLRNKQVQLQKQKQQLAEIDEKIDKSRIYAPADGMVVYSTTVRDDWRYREPLSEGAEIRHRYELFYLPSSEGKDVELAIHESQLDLVKPGMPVRISVDALPEAKFSGTIAKIAPLPNNENRWANPNLKVFDTVVEIEEMDQRMRTGMSCLVEILIHQYEDVLYVPIQSVVRIDGKHHVYVQASSGPKPQPVEVGMANNRMVAILSGVEEGLPVLLAPPLIEEEKEKNERIGSEDKDRTSVASVSPL